MFKAELEGCSVSRLIDWESVNKIADSLSYNKLGEN